MILATNGIKIGLWGKYSPLVMWSLNVNFSQTRKSGLTNVAETACMDIDAKLKAWVEQICQAKGYDSYVAAPPLSHVLTAPLEPCAHRPT